MFHRIAVGCLEWLARKCLCRPNELSPNHQVNGLGRLKICSIPAPSHCRFRLLPCVLFCCSQLAVVAAVGRAISAPPLVLHSFLPAHVSCMTVWMQENIHCLLLKKEAAFFEGKLKATGDHKCIATEACVYDTLNVSVKCTSSRFRIHPAAYSFCTLASPA